MKLNLGCADDIREGWVNVDRVARPGVEVVDLAKTPGALAFFGWPWPASSVEEIRAFDIIEHLPDRIFTMNEMHRVLVPGGVARISVPTTDGRGAWQDPTHVSYWNRNSFWYFEAGNVLYRERFAASYGITAAFEVLFEEMTTVHEVTILRIDLAAVKR